MTNGKIHSVSDPSQFTAHYRKFDYGEIAAILRKGDTVFFEDTEEEPLRRQTVWKATKKLGAMVGKKVIAVYGSMKLNGDKDKMKGYLFSVVDEEG